MHYLGVDHACRDRLQLGHGINSERISVILNFVDTERFRSRPPLPSAPRRALAFGNPFGIDGSLPILQAACQKAGMELDVAGGGSNQEWADPEARLGEYDLVFAKAPAVADAQAQLEQASRSLAHACEAAREVEKRVSEAQQHTFEAEKRASEAQKHASEAEKQTAALEQQLALMRDSTTWRLAQSVSQSAPMRLARPLLKRLKGWVRNRPQKPLL